MGYREGWGEVQLEEVCLQFVPEVGQSLCCSDFYREVDPPSWSQNRQ